MNLRVGTCALLLLAGCQKQAAETDTPKASAADATPAEAKPVLAAPNLAPPAPKGKPTDVLVDVDGTKLTRGEVDQLVEARVGPLSQQIPPDRIDAFRSQMSKGLAQQFAMKTVLLNEAARTGVTLTDKDMTDAYAKLSESLPPGTTLDEALKKSPLGEEKMRQEIRDSVTINKMLEARLSNSVAVSSAEVDKYISENAEEVKTPESVHARHILISTKDATNETAKVAKKAQAESLRQQLTSGTNFADLAKQYSDCPSKERGGDRGSFSRGQMVPEFENAAFSQKTNEVGEVVETQFGYHIIQVLEHAPAGTMPREKVEEKLKRQKQQTAARELIAKLQAAAKITYDPSVAPEPPSTPSEQ
jgi:peptidyl-prolyl cis-trans isomerase C